MSELKYSLIIPYFRTPEITRICLHSIKEFAVGEPEIILVDNDPNGGQSAMLDEFPDLVRINNETDLRGSSANFDAIDVGIQHASHDLLGIFHSDTIMLTPGWDKAWFGHLQNKQLDAIGTLEREANPFRPLRKRIRDTYHHLKHRRNPKPGHKGKLIVFFLLTKKSSLADMGYNFLRDGNITIKHYQDKGKSLEILSLQEISQFMWHTSNITSLLTGQMDDPTLMANYQEKREKLFRSELFQKHFKPVLPAEFR